MKEVPMSPTLLIHIPGQPVREVKLEKDAYILGRAQGCDIVIAAPVVSRQHGKLTRQGADWVYTDLDSRNGSLVDGQRVQTVALRDGKRLQLGKESGRAVMITFQMAAPAESPAVEAADQTVEAVEICPHCGVPLRAGSAFCLSCGRNLASAPPPPARAPETAFMEIVPELVVNALGESGKGYPLAKPVMRVGRASDNEIVIASRLVSNHHLRVENQSGKVTVTDLNSTNGTQVNGVRIPPNQSYPLQPGDVMRVGDLHGNSIQITFGGLAGGLRTQAAGKLDLGKLTSQPSVLIGRLPSCDLYMPHPSVSKNHAMITRQDGEISIRDLGSRNGTFVNGTRVNYVRLRDGDEIQVGPFRLVYDGRRQNLAGSRPLGHRLDAIRLVRQVKGGVTILDDVSVSIQSSEFVALVGGSGAGKSTLMKALNGYEPATKGQLLIDGGDLYSRLDMYRTEMGYVPQDDIIHRELPVRLALWYAAKLRLPDASSHEIEKAIDDALNAVEMMEHQNKRVKNLSGGQRKRVSIASELLAQPTLFFLDEPTSGLDPGLEKKMMYDLKRLADQGRTIVLVTHATTNIEQCDYVAFMAKGRLAYYGPPREAPGFFDAQDFADIYQKLSCEIDPDRGTPPQPEIKPDYDAYVSSHGRGGSSSGRVSASLLWAERFRKSSMYQKYITDRQSKIHASRQPDVARSIRRRTTPAPISFLQQTYYLARRNFDLIRHDVRTLIVLLVMLPMIGLLFGFSTGGQNWWLTGKGWESQYKEATTNVWRLTGKNWESKPGKFATIQAAMEHELKGRPKDTTNQYTPFQDASTLVTMLALALTQGGTFAASYEIVKERPIFQRERAVNLSVWAYVLSKVLVLSLFAIFQVAGVLLMISFFVDLNVPGIIFADFSILELFISLYLAILASIALGLLISALVPSTDVVLYVILAQLFLQIVLTAALFPVDRSIASYVTPGYWATDAMSSIVDLPGLDKKGISCAVSEQPNPETGVKELITNCGSAKSDQPNLAYYDHKAGHLMFSWFAMGSQLVVFTLLTIIVQSRKRAGKD
jgi:ABC-type multidrug transport system ATPase subunit/pSer/pThr/pTyr-binding forkhead associated (FHA) protein